MPKYTREAVIVRNFQNVVKTCNFTFCLGVNSKLKSITQNLSRCFLCGHDRKHAERKSTNWSIYQISAQLFYCHRKFNNFLLLARRAPRTSTRCVWHQKSHSMEKSWAQGMQQWSCGPLFYWPRISRRVFASLSAGGSYYLWERIISQSDDR